MVQRDIFDPDTLIVQMQGQAETLAMTVSEPRDIARSKAIIKNLLNILTDLDRSLAFAKASGAAREATAYLRTGE
jgi:hypothetical protein